MTPAAAVTTAQCIHRWLCAASAGETVTGRCRLCSASRVFTNEARHGSGGSFGHRGLNAKQRALAEMKLKMQAEGERLKMPRLWSEA